MLVNKTTLSYSTEEAGTFIALKGLQEVPEIGVEPEKRDITDLEDDVTQYENGIGDAGDLTYTFLVKDIDSEESSYRVLLSAQNEGKSLYFKQALNGNVLVIDFKGQPSVKLGGGGVNDVYTFTLSIALQSKLNHTFGSGE